MQPNSVQSQLLFLALSYIFAHHCDGNSEGYIERAACLGAVISCWITPVLSVLTTASQAPSGAFECLLH